MILCVREILTPIWRSASAVGARSCRKGASGCSGRIPVNEIIRAQGADVLLAGTRVTLSGSQGGDGRGVVLRGAGVGAVAGAEEGRDRDGQENDNDQDDDEDHSQARSAKQGWICRRNVRTRRPDP